MKKLILIAGMLALINVTRAVTIDVLIVYDNKASEHLSEQNISKAIFATNLINKINIPMKNSGIEAKFNLVHQTQINYDNVAGNDGTNMSQDLRYLSKNAQVKSLREKYKADMVQMVIDIDRYKSGGWQSGIARGICSYSTGEIAESCSRDNAFSVVSIQDIEESNIAGTSIHELGHNLGTNHAREQGGSAQGPFEPYGYGYYFTGNDDKDYYTIMAYRSYTYGRYSAPMFSTPCEVFQGVKVGKENFADNVRVLNQTVGMVANYFGAKQTHNLPANNCEKFVDSIFRDGFE